MYELENISTMISKDGKQIIEFIVIINPSLHQPLLSQFVLTHVKIISVSTLPVLSDRT